MHQLMAATLDKVIADIRRIQEDARRSAGILPVPGIAGILPVPGSTGILPVPSKAGKMPALQRPRWPMIVFRSPKGWTGPKVVDGLPTEATFRSHQVPMGDMDKPEHLKILEDWMKSYRPEELFDATGRLRPDLAELAPKGDRRMGANPHANGGLLLRELAMPDFRDYAVAVPTPAR